MNCKACVIIAICLISCAHAPEPSSVDQPPSDSKALVETSVPAVVPPDVPESPNGACLDYSIADEFGQAQADYYRESKEQAASARGWTFLEPPESSEKGYDFHVSGGALKELESGRFKDDSGQIWLLVGETGGCVQSFGEFVIDKEGSVFEVLESRSCREDVELLQCGMIAIDGCGMAPHPELRQVWFVKASEGARFSPEPQELRYTVDRCVQIAAEEGLNVPPRGPPSP